MKECKRFEKLLPGYLDGELYEKDYHALRAHLEQCAACRAELQAQYAALQLARQVMQAVPTPARMTGWRRRPVKKVDLRRNLFEKIWFSPQFKAALATGVMASVFFFLSGIFVVFQVLPKAEPCFSPPPPVPRPHMKLRKLQAQIGDRRSGSISTLDGNNVGFDYQVSDTSAGVASGSQVVDTETYFGAAPVNRPKMRLRKPTVKVVEGSRPKPSSRVVAKVKTAKMPDIQIPDMLGSGVGLLGATGLGGENLAVDEIQPVSLFGSSEPSDPLQVADAGGSVSDLRSDISLGYDMSAEEESQASLYANPFAAESKAESAGMDDLFGEPASVSATSGRQVDMPMLADKDAGQSEQRGTADYYFSDGTVRDKSIVGYTVVGKKASKRETPTQTESGKLDAVRAAASVEQSQTESGQAVDIIPPKRERKPAGFNPYVMAADQPFSTFSIDVDTASYGLARQQLLSGSLPDTEAVRTEEFINSFDYDYRPPAGSQTFAVHTEMAPSPFRPRMELLKIGVKGRRIGRDDHRGANLTLVIDTSGSMATPDRLGLVKQSLALLIGQLNPDDRVAIVQFGGEARLICEHTPVSRKDALLQAINSLQAGGPTQFDKGLELGYQMATTGYEAGDSNRIIIMSDGVANLGELDPDAILEQVAAYRKKGIYLSVLGFGNGSYDDEMLEQLANRGDGTYVYVDTINEARHLFVDQLAATLHVIASDVKIQVEFNPARVLRYRQVGYENRQLTKEQFRDDTVDAGEVGSGQSVTALYEVELKPDGPNRDPLSTVYVRYRRADNGVVEEVSSPVTDADCKARFEDADPRFQLAACVAEFAEHLRRSPYTDGTDLSDILDKLQPVLLALDLDRQVHELQQLITITAGVEH